MTNVFSLTSLLFGANKLINVLKLEPFITKVYAA